MLKLFATAWLITWFIIDPQIAYLITAPKQDANYQFGIDPHPAWPMCCEEGFYWECEEHIVHGTANTADEAATIAFAHSLFYRTENGSCMVHTFPVN